MRARLSLLAAAPLALAACGGGSSGPPGLAYGLPDPATVTYETGDTTRMDIDAGGQSLSVRISMSATLGTTFTRVGDGVQVSMTVDDLSARLVHPLGGPQTADESAVRGPLVFTMDRRGHVSRVTEPQVSGDAQQFVQPLTIAHTLFPLLPGRGVTAGSSWQDTIRFEGTTSGGQEVSSVSMLTYTVAGDTVVAGRSLVRVLMEGTLQQSQKGSIAGQSVQQSVQGGAEGHYFWDAQRSLVTEHVVDIDARGTMNVAIAPGPLGVRVRGRRTLRLQGM